MNKITWLKTSYWVGAIADFIFAIAVSLPLFSGGSNYVYSMGLFSVVAISWGILLIFATKEPVKCRWVLVPTMIVVALLGFVSMHALFLKLAPLYVTISRLVLGIFIFLLMLVSYIKTKDLE